MSEIAEMRNLRKCWSYVFAQHGLISSDGLIITAHTSLCLFCPPQ